MIEFLKSNEIKQAFIVTLIIVAVSFTLAFMNVIMMTPWEKAPEQSITKPEMENMTTESEEMVTILDPTGKDLTAVTAQIKETETLLKVLKGRQEELRKNVILTVGQVWKECSDDENPFEKPSCRLYEITDIKDGYVKYNYTSVVSDFTIEDSATVRQFVGWYATNLISE